MICVNFKPAIMADDIDELLDEVESKYIYSENKISETEESLEPKKKNIDGQELDAAIHSICSIPDPIETTTLAVDPILSLNKDTKRRCTVVYVGSSSTASGLSSGVNQRKPIQKRHRSYSTSKYFSKKYFTKPLFEFSPKNLEIENARRRQKELIEKLFEKNLAEVTNKMILDARKFKRIKSDVWANFGDIRLLMNESEVKLHNIDYHIIRIKDQDMILCKSFVACVKCSAVFCYESHSYGTSTLRSHLKSCGKQRYSRSQRYKLMPYDDLSNNGLDNKREKPVFQKQMIKFRDHSFKLQEEVLKFILSQMKPFDLVENNEFRDLLQTFIQIGANSGTEDINKYISNTNDFVGFFVNTLFLQAEEEFKNEIEFLYGLSFSVFIWMDSRKNSYITFSCHYPNKNGILKSVMFHTLEFDYEQKTSTDVLKLFQENVSLLNPEFKRLLVIDFSYNMVHAFHENEQFIQCICYALTCALQGVINALSQKPMHQFASENGGTVIAALNPSSENDDILQMFITDFTEDPSALPSFVTLINQCRSLVLHFKENKLQNSLPKNLTLCSSTSWKAVLDMFETINSQWEHIADILIDRNELELFAFDQELLSLIVDFFEIFRDGYTELSSLTSPTLNLVLPWVTKWKTHCLQNEDELPFLAALKSFMSCSIDQEVVKRITIQHKLATMLDPRYKNLYFLTDEDRYETQTHAEYLVKECCETLLLNGIDVHNSLIECDQFSELYYDTSVESMHLAPSEEVAEYLAENFVMEREDLDVQNKFNPLNYWICAKRRYPYLSRVALWILSCPASAVRSDEEFLSSEWMITFYETDFLQKLMHKSLFVKSFRGF